MANFNGAALFQVRKVDEVGRQEVDKAITSMGPHFFKCGKDTLGGEEELLRLTSMWPHFFKCGKGAPSDSHGFGPNASMGPHFFKCGKVRLQLPHRSELALGFNGAALFQVRKVTPGCQAARPVPSFNGAALFQVRKGANKGLQSAAPR